MGYAFSPYREGVMPWKECSVMDERLKDGKALFVSASISGGYALLRLGLDGKAQPLIANHTPDLVLGLPSPNGRSLAVMAAIYNENVWMMENF
jgi:hypothetical protein